MEVRTCCLLVLVAAWCCVPALTTDFVVQLGPAQHPDPHERGENVSLIPKHGHLLAQAKQEEGSITPKLGDLLALAKQGIMPKQEGNHLAHQQRDMQDRLRRNEDPVVCQGIRTVTVGEEESRVITSKNHPNNYPNRHRCFMTVRAANPECTLKVECDKFDVQLSRRCRKDFLWFIEGGWQNYRYCGRGQFTHMSNTNILRLFFRTDRRITFSGFSCSVSCVCSSATTDTTTTTTPDTTTTTTTTTTTSTTTTTTSPSTTTTSSSDQCGECGVANSIDRIVGGQNASENEYPWHVGLKFNGGSNYACGGSIIDEYHILTAAHCVENRDSDDVTVGVGDHIMWDSDPIPLAVQSITIHPEYNSNTLNNDIAILKLEQPLNLASQEVGRVCLPTDPSQTYEGALATATGWGTTSSGGSQPNVLQEVTLQVQDPDCTIMNSNYIDSVNSETMLCAGYQEGGRDTCQGDSGGPLVVPNASSNYELIGITSWGIGCAGRNRPGVYTRVTNYLDWIRSTTNSACL